MLGSGCAAARRRGERLERAWRGMRRLAAKSTQGARSSNTAVGPALIAVCALGDLKRVGELLDAGVKVDSKDRREHRDDRPARRSRDAGRASASSGGASRTRQPTMVGRRSSRMARKAPANMALLLLHAGADGSIRWTANRAPRSPRQGTPRRRGGAARTWTRIRALRRARRVVSPIRAASRATLERRFDERVRDLALHDTDGRRIRTAAGNRRGSTLEELMRRIEPGLGGADAAAITPILSGVLPRPVRGAGGVIRGGLPNAPDDAGRSRSRAEAAGVALPESRGARLAVCLFPPPRRRACPQAGSEANDQKAGRAHRIVLFSPSPGLCGRAHLLAPQHARLPRSGQVGEESGFAHGRRVQLDDLQGREVNDETVRRSP